MKDVKGLEIMNKSFFGGKVCVLEAVPRREKPEVFSMTFKCFTIFTLQGKRWRGGRVFS